MKLSRKRRAESHPNHERWLVSYADFITLLFAFFVVLFAISQADRAKFQKVSDSLKEALGAVGPGLGGTPSRIEMGATGGGETANVFDAPANSGGRVMDMPEGKTHTASDPDGQLQTLKELLEESVTMDVGTTDYSEFVKVAIEREGLTVRIAAKKLFDAGKAEVNEELRPVLERIALVLQKTDRKMRIEGHADAGEPLSRRFASHWDLSTARATWVARYLIEQGAIDPRRMGAAGYSTFRPVSKLGTANATTAGKGSLAAGQGEWLTGMNRRIEVIVLNEKFNSAASQ